jgi:hypothetical protein
MKVTCRREILTSSLMRCHQRAGTNQRCCHEKGSSNRRVAASEHERGQMPRRCDRAGANLRRHHEGTQQRRGWSSRRAQSPEILTWAAPKPVRRRHHQQRIITHPSSYMSHPIPPPRNQLGFTPMQKVQQHRQCVVLGIE